MILNIAIDSYWECIDIPYRFDMPYRFPFNYSAIYGDKSDAITESVPSDRLAMLIRML